MTVLPILLLLMALAAGVLAGGRAAPVACTWPSLTSSVLTLRVLLIARPQRHLPRLAGGALLALVFSGGVAAAYTAQPSAPIIVPAPTLAAQVMPALRHAVSVGQAVVAGAFAPAPAPSPPPVLASAEAPPVAVAPPAIPVRPVADASPPGAPDPMARAKTVLETTCTSCHDLDTTLQRSAPVANRVAWGPVMASMGSDSLLGQDDISLLTRYLDANYPTPQSPAVPKPLSAADQAAGLSLASSQCTVCHDAQTITSLRLTRDGWSDVMKSMGPNAGLSAAQTDLLVSWLTANYSATPAS